MSSHLSSQGFLCHVREVKPNKARLRGVKGQEGREEGREKAVLCQSESARSWRLLTGLVLLCDVKGRLIQMSCMRRNFP